MDVLVTRKIQKNQTDIYTAVTEISPDTLTNDNFGQIFSQQFVDAISELQKDVTYQLVAFAEEDVMFDIVLMGPIVFTATQFVKGKKGLR
ncbi:hypothetical protein [Chengkuizengella sediminis]|uniref:hypothetical protein n=1 Tax=Chengkuizengella sediminis TaxID=1885917 RepID=UPI001389DC81|nr:hypothetical protein [Chengkuizengella sediminis]NDI33597.1 hypothetical protein [Chengkuizengella sediminis]